MSLKSRLGSHLFTSSIHYSNFYVQILSIENLCSGDTILAAGLVTLLLDKSFVNNFRLWYFSIFFVMNWSRVYFNCLILQTSNLFKEGKPLKASKKYKLNKSFTESA